ncbi:hypothetical protein B296_00009744 [Ensete ventricosum]|uniref:Uncharacterized protein n=1 Tax=Ensete ventricosum TaxID=4639 RepID=A0A427B2J6_ENSVE|nr:hypothetical protein B296_00009744 [Ensete ventricosum]
MGGNGMNRPPTTLKRRHFSDQHRNGERGRRTTLLAHSPAELGRVRTTFKGAVEKRARADERRRGRD